MPAINNITAGLTARTLSSDVLNSPKSQLDLNTNTFKPSSSPLPSPKEKKSHLTFSPNIIKVPVVQESKKQSLLCQAQRTNVEAIKKDLSSEIMKDEKIFTQFKPTITSVSSTSTPTNTIKLAPGIGGLTFANSLAFAKLKNNSNTKIVTSNGNVITTAQQLKHQQHIRSSSPAQNINNNITIINNNNNDSNQFQRKLMDDSPKVTSDGFKFVVQNGKGTLIATTTNGLTSSVNTSTLSSMQQHAIANGTALKPQPLKMKIVGPEFPKPAYSYSCLIAMALKNSRAGSLPVSEIYSFMCEHFPYFKTAPNGWKNSVRHNLSLNKCFEKIEKPATNGGQRKGCLWAMNPSKIAKMDEEVQKWSRKDPMAIRKAMVIPENLPALERGEMKHGSLNDSDVEPDDTEDSEPENELEDSIVNGIVPDVDSCDEENSQIENEYDLDVSKAADTFIWFLTWTNQNDQNQTIVVFNLITCFRSHFFHLRLGLRYVRWGWHWRLEINSICVERREWANWILRKWCAAGGQKGSSWHQLLHCTGTNIQHFQQWHRSNHPESIIRWPRATSSTIATAAESTKSHAGQSNRVNILSFLLLLGGEKDICIKRICKNKNKYNTHTKKINKMILLKLRFVVILVSQRKPASGAIAARAARPFFSVKFFCKNHVFYDFHL